MSDIVLLTPVAEMTLSNFRYVTFTNITLMLQDHNGTQFIYSENLQNFEYVRSGLHEIPVLFAPRMIGLNLTQNRLSTLKLDIVTTQFPELRKLDVSNNRIRFLVSCDVLDIVHPLQKLDLTNNDLNRFSSWKCGNDFKVLMDLTELYLSGNNLSYISQELIPNTMKNSDRYGMAVIRAANNPLVCDCPQRWLLEANLIVEHSYCFGSFGQHRKSLQNLLEEGFPCAPSMTRRENMCATTLSGTILVRCPVLSFPSPQVSWVMHSAGELLSIAPMPGFNLTMKNAMTDEMEIEEVLIEIEIDDENSDELGFELTLMCQAVNEVGNISITIHLHSRNASGISGDGSYTCSAFESRNLDDPHSTQLYCHHESYVSETWHYSTPEVANLNRSQRLRFSRFMLLVTFFCISSPNIFAVLRFS